MNPLDYQRDGESLRDCIDRYERVTGRDYGDELAASFDAAAGVYAVELPSIEALRAMSWRHAINAMRDYPAERNREADAGMEPMRQCAACREWFECDGTRDLCDVCTLSAVS